MIELIFIALLTLGYFPLVLWMAKGLIRGLFFLQSLNSSSSQPKSEVNPES